MAENNLISIIGVSKASGHIMHLQPPEFLLLVLSEPSQSLCHDFLFPYNCTASKIGVFSLVH